MKAQLHLLKEKLNKESILNERIIRRAMNEKASKLRRKAYIECIATLVLIGYFGIWPPHFLPLSIGLRTFVCLFLLLIIACNIYILHTFHPQKFINESLVEARRETLHLKNIYSRWLMFFGIPFILIFISAYVYEIHQQFQGHELHMLLASVAIGVSIGLCIGLWKHTRDQKRINELLQQLKELEEA